MKLNLKFGLAGFIIVCMLYNYLEPKVLYILIQPLETDFLKCKSPVGILELGTKSFFSWVLSLEFPANSQHYTVVI